MSAETIDLGNNLIYYYYSYWIGLELLCNYGVYSVNYESYLNSKL